MKENHLMHWLLLHHLHACQDDCVIKTVLLNKEENEFIKIDSTNYAFMDTSIINIKIFFITKKKTNRFLIILYKILLTSFAKLELEIIGS